ncbi:MAG: AMP-binding protein [Bacteroidales bacterium]|nr:AMP-binding protein [Bacteroidales bacterium]
MTAINTENRTYFENLPELLEESALKYRDRTAVSIARGISYSYEEIHMLSLHIAVKLFGAGIKKGDRVALISENNPHWVAAYFGIMRSGGIVTPVLTDFSSNEMNRILEHAEATIVFVSARQLQKIAGAIPSSVKYIISIENLEIHSSDNADELTRLSNDKIEKIEIPDASAQSVSLPRADKDDLAAIIYTSGTTGNSKGVMLSHDNLIFNAINTGSIHRVVKEDLFLSVLPLAHTYECTIGMIIPILNGASITYIDKAPTAAYLGPLLKEIRPTTMLTVPLIIEKIYRNTIRKKLSESAIARPLLKFGPTRKLLHRSAGKKLQLFFGGRMRFFGVGGAAIAPEVEKFLIEARFPYAVGYGLTETSPMLSGFGSSNPVYRSVGVPIEGIEMKLLNMDPVTGEGEIIARGRNVMKGYYKNKAQTSEVLTEDGFFRTGDLGIIDKNGIFYIKGRSKNMILGSNGENIYPEEIESVINEQEFVDESLVMQVKGRLVALIHMNFEKIEEKFNDLKSAAHDKQAAINDKAEELISELTATVNKQLNKNSRLQKAILQKEPFEKTPTKKIKRFRYKV